KTLERDLHDLKEAFNVLATATSVPIPSIVRRELGSGLREATAVAMLSDVHCEQEGRAGETPYPNTYSLDIAERSISRFFAGYRWLIELYRPKFQIRDLILWLGGDLMTGHIHPECIETTKGVTPIETMLWLRPRLMAGIDSLLADNKIERI